MRICLSHRHSSFLQLLLLHHLLASLLALFLVVFFSSPSFVVFSRSSSFSCVTRTSALPPPPCAAVSIHLKAKGGSPSPSPSIFPSFKRKTFSRGSFFSHRCLPLYHFPVEERGVDSLSNGCRKNHNEKKKKKTEEAFSFFRCQQENFAMQSLLPSSSSFSLVSGGLASPSVFSTFSSSRLSFLFSPLRKPSSVYTPGLFFLSRAVPRVSLSISSSSLQSRCSSSSSFSTLFPSNRQKKKKKKTTSHLLFSSTIENTSFLLHPTKQPSSCCSSFSSSFSCCCLSAPSPSFQQMKKPLPLSSLSSPGISFFSSSSSSSSLSSSCSTLEGQPPSGVCTPHGEKEEKERIRRQGLYPWNHEEENSSLVDMAYAVVPSRVQNPCDDLSLCVLHGLLGSKRNLRSFSSLLSSSTILTPDLRNHGESAWSTSMRLSDLSRDLLYFLRQHEDNLFSLPVSSSSPSGGEDDLRRQASRLVSSSSSFLEKNTCDNNEKAISEEREEKRRKRRKRLVLVGHSLGGLTIMHAALLSLKHRDLLPSCVTIDGLVVLDIAPIHYSSYLSTRGKQEEEEELEAIETSKRRRRLSTSEIVSLLADLPMSAFTDKNQLKRTLKATDPPLSDSIVNWLLTAVKERKIDEEQEEKFRSQGLIYDHRTYIQNQVTRQTNYTSRKDSDEEKKKKKNRELERPPEEKMKKKSRVRLEWEMNIYTIHQMLRTRQLHWDWNDEEAHEEEKEKEKEKVFEKERGSKSYVFDRPVLFVKGSHSDYIREDRGDWEEILKLFPKAQLKVVEPAGHWLHAEKPQETARYINEFLNEVQSESKTFFEE